MIDFSLPLEQLPESVAFQDLPPFGQALVRRNILLRQKLHETEIDLHAAQDQINTLKADLEIKAAHNAVAAP